VRPKTILPFALLCASLCPACSDDDDADDDRSAPARPVGTLELSWSIDGQTDPAVCQTLGAEAFEVIIFDEGFFVTEREPPCTDFVTSLDLFVDDYVARTTLVDANDFLVTRRTVEDYFQINEGRVTRLAVDFPSDSAPPLTPPLTDAGVAPTADAGPSDAGVVGIMP
jgi:hypothetical protein